MVPVKYILSYKVKYLLKNERKKIRTCDYFYLLWVVINGGGEKYMHFFQGHIQSFKVFFCMKISKYNFFVDTNFFVILNSDLV
jgi:hypothetical protein